MSIQEAQEKVDEVIELLERDGSVDLDWTDKDWLLKAAAALETCKTLGGR